MTGSPRLRRHLGQLALATAALAAIATSPPARVEVRQEGQPLTLDSASAQEVIRFSVRMDAETEIAEQQQNDRLLVHLKLSPADGGSGAAPSERTVLARLKRLDTTTAEEKTLTTSDVLSSMAGFDQKAFASCGELSCEGEFELALELLEPTQGGPVRVEWSIELSVERYPEVTTLLIELDD